MKIAVFHEWLNTYGGSERVLAEVLKIFPDAQLHALIHNKANLKNTSLAQRPVRASFLQTIPKVEHFYRILLPIMPLAIESMSTDSYDVVISLSHAVAHGVKTRPNQLHVSYISTPMRYAWHMRDDYLHLHRLDSLLLNLPARAVLRLLRRWDAKASARSQFLLANSKWTAENIRNAWGRTSQVIYPPVEVERFNPSMPRGDFYIHVSRLVPYKMTARIIKSFNLLKRRLVVIGDGPEMRSLQRIAGKTIELRGHQPDHVIADLLARAKAFVYMACEDFGIAMAEAQAAGCPVIAYEKGGAAEIVQHGETGLLFAEQNAESMAAAVIRFEGMNLSSKAAHENAARFSSARFRNEFSEFLQMALRLHADSAGHGRGGE